MTFSQRDRPRPNRNSSSNQRISIVIADNSELYREMLRMVIEVFPSLFVLGAVGNGCQALEMVAARPPQLILPDLQLPGIIGPQCMALIREYHPETRVIIITSDDSEDVKATRLAQGAHEVICKRRLYQELRRGITEAFPDEPCGSVSHAWWGN
jgi:DNA-binding NarL/FixJ family response regulator